MSTINYETAIELANHQGRCGDDPPAYAVFEYHNRYYDKTCYAVVYERQKFLEYVYDHQVTRILYCAEDVLLAFGHIVTIS